MMRVLWVGDAAVSTGFARCTHVACDSLVAAGHEVAIIGINADGDPYTDESGWKIETRYPYPIYRAYNPREGGRDIFGATRLPAMIRKLEPDLVVLLNDPWNVPGYLKTIEGFNQQLKIDGLKPMRMPRITAWLAVDAGNQRGYQLNGLDRIAVWTRFAEEQLRETGFSGDIEIVPLGVNTDIFQPKDRAEARSKVAPENLQGDAFIIGVVGRNQPRKRLDLTLEYFADWIHSRNIQDAYLYLHVAPTGERGCDIASLVRHHRIAGRVILAEPHPGHGVDVAQLVSTYNAFDVYLSTTQGEGWGLPALEAMACGVPCLLPGHSAFEDWADGAALLIKATGTALNAPLNGTPYTVGRIPDRQATINALDRLYRDRELREEMRRAGLEKAERYTWTRTGFEIVAWMETFCEEVAVA